jgi:hypothetical protein
MTCVLNACNLSLDCETARYSTNGLAHFACCTVDAAHSFAVGDHSQIGGCTLELLFAFVFGVLPGYVVDGKSINQFLLFRRPELR